MPESIDRKCWDDTVGWCIPCLSSSNWKGAPIHAQSS